MKQKWLILALVLVGVSYLAALGSRSVPKSASAIPSDKVSQGTTPGSGSDLLATVEVSASTNSSPYSIMIFTDGSAKLTIDATPRLNRPKSVKDFGPGSVDAKTLETLLQNVGDVSALTSAKPVSFATVTRITYNGKTSGDISCPKGPQWSQAGNDLHDFIASLPMR